MNLKSLIRKVNDFPEKGIVFRDISFLLANGEALNYTIQQMAQLAQEADIIVGPGARGFLFGTATAAFLKKPFIMVRKQGKLPGKVIQGKPFAVEYRKNTVLEIQENIVKPNQKAVIIDDVLATGGTLLNVVEILRSQQVEVIKIIVLIKLNYLDGFKKLKDIKLESLIEFDN